MENVSKYLSALIAAMLFALTPAPRVGLLDYVASPGGRAVGVPALSASPPSLNIEEPSDPEEPFLSPEEHYRRVWRLAAGDFLYQERLDEFTGWKHKFDGKLNYLHDASDAIREMLASLNDEYTFFRGKEETRDRAAEHNSSGVVVSRMIPGRIGYIKLETFGSQHVVRETAGALKGLEDASGYIVDLRDNKGGDVYDTFSVFALLVDQGEFVRMEGRSEGDCYVETLRLTPASLDDEKNGDITVLSRQMNLTADKPMVVLVNDNTRSAAEMLAGALQCNGRALILGCKTYGKGVVQSVWDFDDGTSIKIVSARYFLPNGACIDRVGLQPDYVVPAARVSDNQLARACKMLRSGRRFIAIATGIRGKS